MKILHIGKQGNMERYPSSSPIIAAMEKVDMPMGLREEEYLQEAADADFIIADAIASISKKLITHMPKLKLIHSEGVAYNSFDMAAATDNQVYVCNCQGMNKTAVAEQALLLMNGMLRDVNNNHQAVKNGHQIEVKEGYMVRGDLKELADCTVGLIGFGDIAQSTAKLLQAYGATLLYYKRVPVDHKTEQEYGLHYRSLDDLLAESDIVSLHVPVTESTMGMANDDFFSKMKDHSYLVNTARGELVDDEALIRALESGKLAMAGLDTLSNEPVQKDHILLKQKPKILSKILFSPHIGGITASSFRRGYGMVWEDIEAVANGKRPKRIVNK